MGPRARGPAKSHSSLQEHRGRQAGRQPGIASPFQNRKPGSHYRMHAAHRLKGYVYDYINVNAALHKLHFIQTEARNYAGPRSRPSCRNRPGLGDYQRYVAKHVPAHCAPRFVTGHSLRLVSARARGKIEIKGNPLAWRVLVAVPFYKRVQLVGPARPVRVRHRLRGRPALPVDPVQDGRKNLFSTFSARVATPQK